MRHHTTLLRTALLATAFAAQSVALAEGPREDVAFYYNRIAFSYGAAPIDGLPAKLDSGGNEGVRKGDWILDTSRLAPSSKPKEIVVVGSKPPATAPAAIAAPAPKPQPYTPIELLPLKGRR
jgi:hypothetical protein